MLYPSCPIGAVPITPHNESESDMPSKTKTAKTADVPATAEERRAAKRLGLDVADVAQKLTSEQKRRLAWVLLEQAAMIARDWDDMRDDFECSDVPAHLVAPLFSKWLQYLPHADWPENFPDPTSKYVRGDV